MSLNHPVFHVKPCFLFKVIYILRHIDLQYALFLEEPDEIMGRCRVKLG